MELIGRNLVGRVRATFTGVDGEAVAPTNPRITITRDSDGAKVADNQEASLEGNVAYYDVPPQDEVDLLHCVWTGTVDGDPITVKTRSEVVGGFLCPLEGLPGDTPQEQRQNRTEAERKLEDAANVAFRPRYAKEVHFADGTNFYLLRRNMPQRVFSVEVDGVPQDAGMYELQDSTLVLRYTPQKGTAIAVAYEHGYPTPPEPVGKAVVKLANYLTENSDDRITRFREDDQEIFFALPGSGSTALPEVNQVIRDYGFVPYF